MPMFPFCSSIVRSDGKPEKREFQLLPNPSGSQLISLNELRNRVGSALFSWPFGPT